MFKKLFQKLTSNRVQLYGRFGLTVFDESAGVRTPVLRIQKKNQVVNDGRLIMLALLRQDASSVFTLNPEYNQLWSLSVGTTGTPPTATDSNLYAPIWASAFLPAECVIDLVNFEIVVSKLLPTTECNGSTLREAGLFSRGDDDDPAMANPALRRLYARQVHSPIDKIGTMSILYDWRIGVTVA